MASTPPRQPSNRPPQKGGPRGRWIFGGGIALFVVGAYLALQSYSNNPGKFYVGAVLAVLGAISALIAAGRKRDKPNGNHGGS